MFQVVPLGRKLTESKLPYFNVQYEYALNNKTIKKNYFIFYFNYIFIHFPVTLKINPLLIKRIHSMNVK